MSGWRQLGEVSPRALVDARLQLHWCCQIVAAPGKELGEPVADYRHTALEWLEESELLAGVEVGGSFRAAIAPATLALMLVDPDDGIAAAESMDGRTLADGLAWMDSAIESRLGASPGLGEVRRDLPHHPVADGVPVTADLAALAELSRHFANADCMLRAEARSLPGASPVSLWPHHLDMATLWSIDVDAEPEEARSVNLGMALGDEGCDEPYWYVTPWPAPDPDRLPDLAVGEWNTEGWVGAVLPSSAMPGPSEAQERLVADFIQGAVAASRSILSS